MGQKMMVVTCEFVNFGVRQDKAELYTFWYHVHRK